MAQPRDLISSVSPILDLHQELVELNELNRLRRRALDLREAGIEGLLALEVSPPAEIPNHWYVSEGEIEAALLLQAQSRWAYRWPTGDKFQSRLGRLKNLPLSRMIPGPAPQHLVKGSHNLLPVLTAVRILQALAHTPKYVFSRTALVSYYAILREIYTAEPPDWSVGGARAGAGGPSTAFVTGECMRAVFAFSRINERTARFFGNTRTFASQLELVKRLSRPDPSVASSWVDCETRRLTLAWETDTANHLSRIALHLRPFQQKEFSTPMEYVHHLGSHLEKEIVKIKDEFVLARDEIDNFRREEEQIGNDATTTRYLDRTETAHRIARDAVERSIEEARTALAIIEERRAGGLLYFRKLSEQFARIGAQIRTIIQPPSGFVAAVLDRELRAAAAPSEAMVPWSPSELAFAAAAVGYSTGWRADERLDRAAHLLVCHLDHRGRFIGRAPFQSTRSGYTLFPIGAEILRALAQLLQHTEVRFPPILVRRMLHLFEENLAAVEDPSQNKQLSAKPVGAIPMRIGWRAEFSPLPERPAAWVSAIAVQALDRIIRMMDVRINASVLRHFSVEYPHERRGHDLTLNTLRYPDYGLARYPSGDSKHSTQDLSIALHLELTRAYLLRVPLSKEVEQSYGQFNFSLILYGPPGTGKTTLIEALARSSGAPLVRLSPSDLAESGEEGFERRTRDVFDALSMLTGVVIILDEFEPILSKRGASDTGVSTMAKVLTPGMLPKLTKLYGAAKKKWTVYCLMTNYIEALDNAAIRSGRFDLHLPILQPDPISRAAYFLLSLAEECDVVLDSEQERRFLWLIRLTSGMSAAELAKHWWPRHGEKDHPVTNYILNGTSAAVVEEGERRIKGAAASFPVSPPSGDRGERLSRWEAALAQAMPSIKRMKLQKAREILKGKF